MSVYNNNNKTKIYFDTSIQLHCLYLYISFIQAMCFQFWLRYRDCNLLILRNMYPLHTITHTHLVSVETSLIQIKGDHMSRPRQFAATLYCSKMLAIQRVKAEDSSMLEHAANIKVMMPLYRTGGPERYWILQGS